MIYITGDTHGNQILWDACINPKLEAGDTVIVAGDFGVGFWDGRYWSEETFYDYIAEQPYTVLFVDGNHEDAERLNSYDITSWGGGRVHKLRHNLIHLMRGEIVAIDGKKLFCLGGGYSLDKWRRKEGYDWWPQEMPNQAEYQNACDNLAKVNHQVDYIITHTAPAETIRQMAQMTDIKSNVQEEQPLNTFLEYLRETVSYQKWYFGHFHIDGELWRNQYAVYHAMRELETGKVIRYRV